MKPKSTEEFPITLRKAGCQVRIYATPNKGHDQFTLTYYLGARRVRQKFSDLATAQLEAQAALAKLVSGETEALKLTGQDRAVYVHAVAKLSESLPGYTLLQVVEEFVAARSGLPAEVSLREASAEWRRRHTFPSKSVAEVTGELLAAKRSAGVSDVYLKDLGRLHKFAEAFRCPILNVETAKIESFLLGLGKTARTRNNYRRNINTLFGFARRRGYLPRDHDVMSGVEKARGDDGEIEIFTPEELGRILATARPEMIPYLAIAAFAGLRAGEIQRLDWSEINLAERHIEVKAAKAKTASRRHAPVTDNLAARLAPHVRPFGPVAPYANMSKQLTQILAPAAGLPWKHNGLRHSFISYRLATIKDTAQVALEAGNSPQMIFKHYRKLVTEAEAKRWFAITPVASTNVIALPSSAASA